MLLRKLKHTINKMLSRQGQYVDRNRPSPWCTVPAGRNVSPKIHIPSLTGRVRAVRRLFSTNMLSLTGHVETRCIASPQSPTSVPKAPKAPKVPKAPKAPKVPKVPKAPKVPKVPKVPR
jgi:hypothetical protein